MKNLEEELQVQRAIQVEKDQAKDKHQLDSNLEELRVCVVMILHRTLICKDNEVELTLIRYQTLLRSLIELLTIYF